VGSDTPPWNKETKKEIKMNNKNKFSLLLVVTIMTTGLLSSCFKEDLTDCPRPFQVTIKAVCADGNDITESGDVEQVILFVFDEEETIFNSYILSAKDIIEHKAVEIAMDYPGHPSLQFVAWGNLDEREDYTDISSVKELNDFYVKLKTTSSKQSGFLMAQPPGDLFEGNIIVQEEFGGIEPGRSQVVEIHRITEGVTITAIGLKQWNGNKDGTYGYRLRESFNSCDCFGHMGGEKVYCEPTANFNEKDHFIAPLFYMFPPADNITYVLDILFNGEVIFTADRDSDGKPFNTDLGRTLNIIIDFSAELNIMCVITPWNVVYQYVVYE
jgi:hypothetical protein